MGRHTTARDKYDARVTWLTKLITPAQGPRAGARRRADLDVEVYVLPNLGGVNVLIHGLLGEGVAASTRFDPQAKGLGEWVRSRMVAHRGGPAVSDAETHCARLGAEFVRREVAPHLQEWEDAGEVPRELHLAAAKQGLLGVAFPEEVGGEGGDLLDSVDAAGGDVRGRCVQRADGRRCSPAASRCRTSRRTGNADLVDRFVRPTLAGEKIGSLAVTEPGGGSDVAGIRTTAVRDGDHYVVNGAKTFITSGVRADFVTTAVRTGGPGHARRQPARRREGHARLHRRPVAAQDGLALLRHRRAVVRRRAGPGRPTWSAQENTGFYQIAEQFVVERIALAVHAYGIAAAVARADRGVLPRPRDLRQAADRQPGGPAQAGRDAAAGRGRPHLHPRGRRAGTSPGENVIAEACLAKQTASTPRRTSATRRCSCTAAPATCTGPRWSGTTATPGSCRSEEERPRC